MPKSRTWTEDQLKTAVKSSRSLRETIQSLNLAVAGGSYCHIRSHIDRLQLDTSHWNGQSGKGRYGSNKQLKLKDILVKDSNLSTSHLRKILLREGLKQNFCEICKVTQWNGKRLTCELHHKNKIRNDHRLENLQMLCPNCHSQQ